MSGIIRRWWQWMHALPQLWDSPVRFILWPFSVVYSVFVGLYGRFLRRFCVVLSPVPVIVIGNLTVGGVGKTPLVMALVAKLTEKGLRVGIVSRGYRAKVRSFPYEVSVHDTALKVGDEPLLLAQKTQVPVVIAPRRASAVAYLVAKHRCQVIVSDDGLQHEVMGRAIEVVVVDGQRGFGNGFCLPAGPLREPLRRLKQVDFVVLHGSDTVALDFPLTSTYRMDLLPKHLTHLKTGQKRSVDALTLPIAAVAAIGYPERFFASLRALNLVFQSYVFPDHHAFVPEDVALSAKTVLMTDKDAVKCQPFATDAMHVLSVEATLSPEFWDALWAHPALKTMLEKGLVEHEKMPMDRVDRFVFFRL